MEQRRINFQIVHSSSNFLSSDFSFTSYQFSVDWQFFTWLRRRLLPMNLDLRITAGTKNSHLPVQRYGIVDANFVLFAPFGTLKTLYGTPYAGEKYLGVFWEHNFRTVPFELLGLMSLARKGIGVIVGGAHGRTWISKKSIAKLEYSPKYIDNFHHELIISINSILNLLRLDFAYRLDQPDFNIGIGFALFF